jgi:hypothetical protein
MAKGNACPQCSESKFHLDDGPVGKCSACGAVGFWESPQGVGAGKGRKCGSCKEQKLRDIHSSESFTMLFCNGCRALLVLEKTAKQQVAV